jgi:hypothetical protein
MAGPGVDGVLQYYRQLKNMADDLCALNELIVIARLFYKLLWGLNESYSHL